MKPMGWKLLLCIMAYMASLLPAHAVTCSDITYKNIPYTICEVSHTEQIRLFLRDANGEVLGSFDAVEASLDGSRLAFAMNGGMYHSDRRPVGLYVENEVEYAPISDGGGYGNFGLLPNGVFCVEYRVRVWSRQDFLQVAPDCKFATQSGPMLVIDGELHPAFIPDSTSRYYRNGVGTSKDGSRAIFAISNAPVTFHQFGSFFRDYLELENALFLDGNVSRLYAPSIDRADSGRQMGPVIGVVD